MIDVVFRRGIYLPEVDFWLDPWDAKGEAFVSHAHADHFSRHGSALCSRVTAALLRRRFGMAEGRLEGVEFGEVRERNGFELRVLAAGHIVGSGMLHVRRKADGATLLYTGDFKVRRGRTMEAVEFLEADTLIMETTFGLPHLVFPAVEEVDAGVLRFVRDALRDGDVPVLFGYSLGKAQEAVALLAEHGIPVLSHVKVAEMTRVCREVGVDLPEPVVFDGVGREGYVIVAPPNAVSAKVLRGVKNKRTAMLTGWALQAGAFFRYRVDEVLPMSDHADHPGLLECVARVKPRRVLTVHGYAREFAAELRGLGLDAWCAMGGDQLELGLERGVVVGVRAEEVVVRGRPGCEVADFSDVCGQIGGTSSRLAKVECVVNNLRAMGDDEGLAQVVRWFTGEALPRRGGRRVLNVGAATIKQALLGVAGVRVERYREISAGQNDLARTARVLLGELSNDFNPLDYKELYNFFVGLERADGALVRVKMLAGLLGGLHPVEAETVVRLLTGDLRIGLKEGLVEEAVARAFEVPEGDVRQANMLTGDLGITSVLARGGRLGEAELKPLVPIRCMLAAPLERGEDDGLVYGKLPFSGPYWLEPKYDGIRAQLHKVGGEVGLFSRDLRPLDGEFPELVEAARGLEGDFILDGELIAYAEGRKLGFADLQKRLGRRRQVGGDFFMEGGEGAGVAPLRYVAFDLLWRDGVSLLGCALAERREGLERMVFSGMFGVIERWVTEDVEGCFKEAIRAGHEGLIVKDGGSVYSPGRRGKCWMKLKGVMPTLDCVVVYAEQGHGRRVDVLSDYTFAVRDEVSGVLRVIGKAYSGLRDEEIEELTEHFKKHTIVKERRRVQVEPNVVLEIAFDAIRRSPRHDSGLALRFPRIKAIRYDKGVGEIDTLRSAEALLRL